MKLKEAPLPIHGMPGHLIRRLQQISVSIFFEEMAAAGVDLTPVQYAALQAVSIYPRIDQATLSGVIAYDRTTIGGVIDRLEAKGLVRRTVSKANRRARQLVIEPEGANLLERVTPLVLRVQARILQPLDSSEKKAFMRLITNLAEFHNENSRAPLRPLEATTSNATVPAPRRVEASS